MIPGSSAGRSSVGTMLLFDVAFTDSVFLVSPLHLAARSGLKKAVQELLSRGASVQTVDENGRKNRAGLG